MNKMVLKMLYILLALIALFPSLPLYSQVMGSVKGRVIDSMSGEPVIGVTVLISDLRLYGVSDINGEYIINGIPEGIHRVIFQLAGYQTSEAEMKVTSGTASQLSITLSYKTAKEVVVKAKKISNTEASILRARQKAPVAQDAISAAQISKTPDSDVSDVAKRITGVSIVGGKTVYIRGLGERYSGVMINGSAIPSPDPDRRVVPLDIFPVSLFDNIVIMKAYTVDFPGEFGGGTVVMNPSDHPETATIKAGIGTGYNSTATGRTFLTHDGGKYDFFGFDDGTRALPRGVKNDYVTTLNYSKPEIEKIGENFNNYYTPEKTTGILPFKADFSYGDSFRISENKSFGLIFSGMFNESSSNRDISFLRINDNWSVLKEYTIDKSTYETGKGILFSGALSMDTDKIRLISFYSHQSEKNTLEYNGYNNDRQESIEYGGISSEKIYKLQFINTGLFFSQLSGEHFFPYIFNSSLEWTGTYSLASRDEPDTRTSVLIDRNSTGEYMIYRADDIERFFQNHDDYVYEFAPSISIPFSQWNSLQSRIKIGGGLTYRERNSESRTFKWDNGNRLGSEATASEPVEDLFTNESIVSPGSQDATHYFIKETTGTNAYYTGILDIYAAYAQLDMPLFPGLRLVGGLRYEFSDMDLIIFDPVRKTEGNIPYEPLDRHNFMPAAGLTYSLTEDINIRLAYSRTLARPDFREVSEFKYSPMVSSETIIGNPDLKQCDIDNADFRIEWFPSASEILAFSVFYKYLDSPIEMLEVTGTPGTMTFRYVNAVLAENMGLEFEARKGLGFIADAVNDFSIGSNLTLIKSQIEVKDTETAKYTNSDRPLQGQSPYVINAYLDYDNENIGLNTMLLYNIFGKRIQRVGTVYSGIERGDVYEESMGRLDLVIKQRVFKNGSIKLSASNLLDPDISTTQERPKAGTDKKKVFILEEYKAGRSFGLSYSHTF